MEASTVLERGVSVDPIEEMRLRVWARRHYSPVNERDASMHPIALDEMRRKDCESNN